MGIANDTISLMSVLQVSRVHFYSLLMDKSFTQEYIEICNALEIP